MRLLATLEQRLERLAERPVARLFPRPLRAVQLERRLERALESEGVRTAGRVLAPDLYRVRLHPADLAAMRRAGGDLEGTLAAALVARARARRYQLRCLPEVHLNADANLSRGEIRVAATLAAPELAAGDPQRAPAGATAVYRQPPAELPTALALVAEPGLAPRRVALVGSRVRVGRAPDNELVLRDGTVSRYHGEFRVRRGVLVYADLGSRNGTWVEGSAVRELALGLGDRLRLGETTITIEPA